MTVAEKKKYLLEKENYDVDDLVILVEVLRSEEGCPWDREQTHKSIRKDFIEAAKLDLGYEAFVEDMYNGEGNALA